jgi:hypothetical protein
MSCPVSSRREVLLAEPCLKGATFAAVVGGSILPALPDDVEPGGEFRRQGFSGILQASLLAARPTGEAPSCGAEARLPVRSLFNAPG